MPPVVLLACGDVGPIHRLAGGYALRVKSTLAEADLRFAQCERVYSNRGTEPARSGERHSRVDPAMADVFSECAFDVVSVASNHAMDWGAEALLDSIATLQSRGIATVGAGIDLDAARTPAVLERHGVRVAFLARCSVLRDGYEATAHRPGVAPLRVHTRYETAEYQAGMPPRVITEPYAEDLAGLLDDIRAARTRADVVVVSLHWGLHFIPRLIADYQPAVARAVIAAGADVIVGHHAHVPKAIEVIDDKACFYSLSNFIMSAPSASAERRHIFQHRYRVELDPDYPHLPYGVDAKRSLIARLSMGRRGIERVGFLPVMIDRDLRPEVLRAGDPRFDDAVRYMEWASDGMPHYFGVDGNEVVVTAPHPDASTAKHRVQHA